MTYPTIPTTAAGRILTTNQADTSATRTFPNLSGLTKNSGDLLLAIIVAYQTTATSNAAFSGWTGSFSEIHDSSTSTSLAIGIAYKWSDGSETGTISVTEASTITGHASMILLSIPGAHGTTPPAVGARVSGTTSAANPASFNPANWDAEDTLWIAVAGSGETSTSGTYTGIASAPTNYTGYVDTGMSADAIGATEAAVAFRQLNAASEDVGTFSVDVSSARNGAVVIAVRPAVTNQPPTADAGTDQNVTGNDTVELDGTGSSDPDGSISTWSWTQTAGTTVTLTGANTSTPSFTAPNTTETLTFQLQVTDDGGLSATDSVNVGVTAVFSGIRGSSRLAAQDTSSPRTIDVPSGTTTGDITIVYGTAWAPSTAPPTWGVTGGNGTWTKFLDTSYTNDSGTSYVNAWWKRATAADSGTYSVSGWGSGWNEWEAVSVPGIAPSETNPIEDFDFVAATSASTSFPAVSVDSTSLRPTLLWFGETYGLDADVPPTGWTELQDASQLTSLAYRLPATEAVPMVAISDTFDSEETKWSGWNQYLNATDGVLAVTGTWSGIESASTYNMLGSSVFVEVLDGIGLFDLKCGTNDRITTFVDSGTIFLQHFDNGSFAGSESMTFNSTTMRWWRYRINSDGNAVYLDTSPDGNTWTQRLTSSIAPVGSYNASTIRLGSGAAQPLRFDNLNIRPNTYSTASAPGTHGTSSRSAALLVSVADHAAANTTNFFQFI